MTIGTSFLTRYTIPLIVAAVFSGDMEIPKQMEFHERNGKLADELLSDARGEGHTTETFDYIIVGGGAAGGVLANKLTASGSHRVLLLEAGGDPNPVYEVPFAQGFFFETGINGWNYTSTEQRRKHCYDTKNFCRLPRGKGLGGGTSINDVLYNRGKPKYYDRWANFTGDSSWSWDNIHQTYNSFEDYHGFYPENEGKHGYGGELYVGKVDSPGVELFEEAAQEMGYSLGDLNGGKDFTYGFNRIDHNIKNGLRMGTYQAFIKPALERPNLTIYRYAYATKIETEHVGPGHQYRATGVHYTRHNQTRFVKAAKEVIVSAGAFETPKLLMLSGIGPYEHLREVNITCILNLPVGKYLQDHPGANIYGEAGGFKINRSFARFPHSKESLREYIDHGTGPLNQFTFGQIISGYMTSYKNEDKSWPDLHTYVRTNYLSDNSQSFTFGVELERYETWGTVTLNKTHPTADPVIDTNILEDSEDIERIVDGIEQMLDIFRNSTAFQREGIQEEPRNYTECRDLQGDERDYWRCVVIHKTGMTFHTTSTCRMGRDHTEAVLDSKLKVFGTENLRVIDGSAIPFAPTGNTAMPCMLIGARGAEIILSGQ